MTWVKPLRGSFPSTATYGQRGSRWSSGMHTGHDWAAPRGTPVYAVDDGRVTAAGNAGAYGLKIEIDHGEVQSWYAHLNSIEITVGTRVTQHQRIGAVGSTGNTTGSHLHLEARDAHGHADPLDLISGKRSYQKGVSDDPVTVPAFTEISDIFTDPATWKRVAYFGAGVIIGLVALVILGKENMPGAKIVKKSIRRVRRKRRR